MSGLDILAALKADPGLRRIPVVVMTSSELRSRRRAQLRPAGLRLRPRRHLSSRGTVAGAAALPATTFHWRKTATGHATLLKADVAVTPTDVCRGEAWADSGAGPRTIDGATAPAASPRR